MSLPVNLIHLSTPLASVLSRNFRVNHYNALLNIMAPQPFGSGLPVNLNEPDDTNIPLAPDAKPICIWHVGITVPSATVFPDTVNPCAGIGADVTTDPVHTLVTMKGGVDGTNCTARKGYLMHDIIDLDLVGPSTLTQNYCNDLTVQECCGGCRDCCNDCECGCACDLCVRRFVIIRAPCCVCDKSKRVVIRNYRTTNETVRVYLANGCEKVNKKKFYDIGAGEAKFLVVVNGKLVKIEN